MKKILKFSSIGVFVLLFSFILASPSLAVEKTVPNEEIKGTLDMGIFNVKILSQEGNNFKISFDVVNNDVPQAGLKYVLKLVKETDDKGQFLIDSYSPDEVFSVGSKSSLTKEFNYTAPAVSGKYKIFVFLTNESGGSLGLNFAGEVSLSSKEGSLEILTDSCYLTIPSEKIVKQQNKYTLLQGIDISKDENLKLNCEVNNPSKSSVDATPQYETHLRNMAGEIVSHEGGDSASLSFKPGEKKIVSLTLPKASKSQAYDVKVVLKNGSILSNPIIVHYVVQGASATILRASLDKDYYNKNDNANIFVYWAPSADSFSGSRIGGGVEDKKLTIVSSIKNSTGGKCIKQTENNLAEISTSHNANIPVVIKSNCKDPVLSLQIKDEAGNILDEKEFNFKSENVPNGGSFNQVTLFIIVGVLIVVGLAIYFISLKKKNNNETINQNETNVQQ